MSGITRRDGEHGEKLLESELSDLIIGKAIIVHSTLGPGLLESVYEACFEYEYLSEGLSVERQKVLPVKYKNIRLDDVLRALRLSVLLNASGRILKCLQKSIISASP